MWWRHQMETFSALLAICVGNSPVPGEFPAQRRVTRSFDVFFDLCLNKRLSKQWWGWWFEMPSCPLWHHCNDPGTIWPHICSAAILFGERMLWLWHYDDVIMGAIASQITSLTIVYSTIYWGSDQSKHQSSASLAFVRGIHRGPLNSPHKWPVTRKMFPFDDVIMVYFKLAAICYVLFGDLFSLTNLTFFYIYNKRNIKGIHSWSYSTGLSFGCCKPFQFQPMETQLSNESCILIGWMTCCCQISLLQCQIVVIKSLF